MEFICNFCNNIFTQKSNLHKHLVNNRCKKFIVNNIVRINNLLQEQSDEIKRSTKVV